MILCMLYRWFWEFFGEKPKKVHQEQKGVLKVYVNAKNDPKYLLAPFVEVFLRNMSNGTEAWNLKKNKHAFKDLQQLIKPSNHPTRTTLQRCDVVLARRSVLDFRNFLKRCIILEPLVTLGHGVDANRNVLCACGTFHSSLVKMGSDFREN